MNYYIAWAEKIRELEAVFNSNKIKATFKQEFPDGLYKVIMNNIKYMAEHGNRSTVSIKAVDYARKKFYY